MRKIAATYLFPIHKKPIKNGILVCSDNGEILEIIDNNGVLKEQPGLEFYSGILVPGFVNAHCHLELSHLHQKIEEKTGIGGFIGKINRLRNEETQNKERAIWGADRKMWAAGISAIGDISNSLLTLDVKQKSKIYYHTFIESFGFHPDRAERAFDLAKYLQDEFRRNGLPESIVPHSPYSVSAQLFKKIQQNALAEKSILSIHNQESKGEEDFFKTGTGEIANHLQHNLGIDISHWKPTAKSSVQSILKYLPAENQLLLVHNTFTKKNDVAFLKKYRSLENTFLALCPRSNLYIESTLPPVDLFRNENLQICVGTDSLASNYSLSVLEELKTLQENFPEISLEELLKWGTLNGAKSLRIQDNFGSFEVGKKPGVNLIAGVDLKQLKLTQKCKVRRIL